MPKTVIYKGGTLVIRITRKKQYLHFIEENKIQNREKQAVEYKWKDTERVDDSISDSSTTLTHDFQEHQLQFILRG